MINLIQPITVQQAYDGITHAVSIMKLVMEEGWWWWWRRIPLSGARNGLPREIRAWRQLRIVKRDESFSLIFFLPERKYIELELRSEELQGAHEVGGAPPPSWTSSGPPGLHLLRGFFIIFSRMFRGVSGHSENICFLHIKQHHGNSAENSVSPG